MFIFPITIIR